MQLSYKDYSISSNLFTGEIKKETYEDDYYENGNLRYGQFGERYPNGYVKEKGTPYRFGGLYEGYKGFRFGVDSDRHVRHPIQNHFAHGFASPQPGFRTLSNSVTPYFQYQSPNPYTLW